jgi:hypothetical protein
MVACLLILLAVQAIRSMQKKSVTVDEIMYITAGYYHLKTGDFQLNMTNPPFMKLLSALPLLALDLKLPPMTDNPKNWTLIEHWRYSRSFLYENLVDADKILFIARLPIVLLSIILAVFVFLWSTELYSAKAGLFALLLYSFSPNILAHSRLATHDLGLTAFMFISSYFFWKYIKLPSARSLILCGFFFGLAMLTKTTAIFLIPIFVLYTFICMLRKNGLRIYEKLPFVGRIPHSRTSLRQFSSLTFSILLISLLGLIILNIGYGFQGSLKPLSTSNNHQAVYQRLPINNTMTRLLSDVFLESLLPIPSPYAKLLKFQSQLTANSGGVYFAGKLYSPGLWYLMIVSFFLKTPIPLLILLAISITYMILQKENFEAEWLILSFILVLMFIFSYLSNVNVGLRYVLPIYPFFHVLASRVFTLDFARQNLAKGLILALSAWYVLGAISIHPHYLAYFNEFIGGPQNGYKYLADSNIDWGQDLKGLKHYMEDNQINKIKLAYFGSADVNYYGIDYDYLPSVGLTPKKPGQYWWYEMNADYKSRIEPRKGTIAISATLLASPSWMTKKFRNTYDWLREYEPVDNVGYSILIYKIE